MKKIIVLQLIFILSLLYGCSKSSNPANTPQIDFDELIKSPTTIQIDSTNFNLSVYLWRDYMPISPPEGKPMTASIDIIAISTTIFPTGIDADKMWLFDSTETWEADLTTQTPTEDYILSKRASGGPLWETGILVDAVVRLVKDDSIYYYLKQEQILINRTD